MKARLLTKLLNNTGYNTNNKEEYIAFGSPLCHDLISVNKKTLKIKYALDTWNEGRKSLERVGGRVGGSKVELLFIWDKLQELINSEQILDIINGDDVIENPLPVYTVENGKLIETFTDAYGYPNKTISGELMYDNCYFNNRLDAIKYGIDGCESDYKDFSRRKDELEKDLQKINDHLEKEKSDALYLKALYIDELKK